METSRRDNDRAQARPSARDRGSWAGAWLLERNVPTRRSLSGPVGGRLLRSTSWRLWPLTTRRLMGEKGALLRREGLYSSHIVEWRRARDAGALAGLARPRGRPQRDAREDRIARWSRRNASWSRSWLSPLRGEGAGKTAREPNPRAGRYKLAPASRPPSSWATGQTALITRRPKNHGGNMLSDSPNTRTFSLMHVPRSRRTRCPGRY
jgi:hypothetical protein